MGWAIYLVPLLGNLNREGLPSRISELIFMVYFLIGIYVVIVVGPIFEENNSAMKIIVTIPFYFLTLFQIREWKDFGFELFSMPLLISLMLYILFSFVGGFERKRKANAKQENL